MSDAPVPERTRVLLGRMRGVRVVVVGDLMLDRFLWGTVSRISPEAPVPVVRLGSETALLGGAGNVARNLRALGGLVDLVGVVGRDAGAGQFRQCLSEAGLDGSGVHEAEGWATTVKSRVIAHHQQVVRIDRETTEPLPESLVNRLAEGVIERLPGAKALLVSDYDKGVVSAALLRRILPEAAKRDLAVAVDPKPSNTDHYRPVTVLTPNVQEARAMTGYRGRDEEGFGEEVEGLRKRLGCGAILLTQGELGMTLHQSGRPPWKIPALAREVFDVTGAGDTVIAALGLALAAGATLEEASHLANAAAGCVVAKLGTAVVSSEELQRSLETANTPPSIRR